MEKAEKSKAARPEPRSRALTPKEEAYCRARAEGKGLSAAYRASRDCSKMSTASINSNAKKLERKLHIKARVEELGPESGVSDGCPSQRARPRARAEPEASEATSPMSDRLGGDALHGRDEASGRVLRGNSLWTKRTAEQRVFADGEALWAGAINYFKWTESTPLYEAQLVTFQGVAKEYPVAKMRPMTIRALCLFLGISRRTWADWKKDRPDLAQVITDVEAVIYTQKFEGAAAGLLNANIIARELGLADKTELMGKDGGPIQTQDLEPRLPSKDACESWGNKFLHGGAKREHASGVGRGDDEA